MFAILVMLTIAGEGCATVDSHYVVITGSSEEQHFKFSFFPRDSDHV